MTYYLDVTELIGLRYNSGIQRVVREVTRHALGDAGGGRTIAAVIAVGGRFHRLSAAGEDVAAGRAPDLAAPPAPLAPAGGNPLKAALRRAPTLFSIAQRLKFARRLRSMRALHNPAPAAIGPGDTVVLLDSSWSGGGALRAAAAARRAGARIALVAYDIIPISHPRLVSRAQAYDFPRALRRGLALADVVLPISRAAAADVLAVAGPALDPGRVAHFYLGHDFSPPAASAAETTTPFGPAAGGRGYLMVGTIEPRKGHLVALDAFERLWAAGGAQRLVVIGKVGWRAEAFMERARAHPLLGERLFLIHDASDATLAAALDGADALVMASSLEGFGLPLVEALSADRPVIASDIAVFREIAGDAALFFRCGDADALAAAVTAFERDPDRWRAAAQGFRWPDWREATATFLDTLDALLARQPARRSR